MKNEDAMIIAPHFPFPGVGQISKNGEYIPIDKKKSEKYNMKLKYNGDDLCI